MEEINNHPYSPYEQKYMDIIDKLKQTFIKKNHDYGSSVKKNYDKFETYGKNEGLKYVFGRIAEKYDRLENLIYGDHMNQVVDESIADTLLDMANYAILASISFNQHKELVNQGNCMEHQINTNKEKLTLSELIDKYQSSPFLYVKRLDGNTFEKLPSNTNFLKLYTQKEIDELTTGEFFQVPYGYVSLYYLMEMIHSLIDPNYKLTDENFIIRQSKLIEGTDEKKFTPISQKLKQEHLIPDKPFFYKP